MWVVAGVVIFVDALDGALHFPIQIFAWLFLIEGLATLAVAGSGVGGQRILRYVKGSRWWSPPEPCSRGITMAISCCR